MIKPLQKREQCYVDFANMTLPTERALLDIAELGKEVQRRRKQMGIGQMPFSCEVQVANSTIAKFESGKAKDIHVGKLDRIARGLKMKLWELIKAIEE